MQLLMNKTLKTNMEENALFKIICNEICSTALYWDLYEILSQPFLRTDINFFFINNLISFGTLYY